MLTEIAIRSAKPADRTHRMYDSRGLYLEVSPAGGKWFRFKYKFDGKEKRLSLGVYPDVGLRKARDRRDEARRLLADGVDPSAHRQAAAASREADVAYTFEIVAREWFEKQKPRWAATHVVKTMWILEHTLFPYIGLRPIADVSPLDLLGALRRTESRGALETARRARGVAGQVLRYAVATGSAERDSSQDLRGALAAPNKKHLAAVTEPEAVGRLLLAMDGYRGSAVVAAALRLAPLTFVRPGELRQARWAEMDLEGAEWRIPAERMKGRQPHIVPLSSQAVAVLRELHPLTGHFEFVFPGGHSPRRAMSNNAVLAALRRSGIGTDEMTGHGFRAMARTILDEVLQFPVDWIEHQLAHAVRDANGRAYNRTSHLPGRKKMMQAWADYLDQLRNSAAGKNVTRLHTAAA
jgi:integrase